MSHSWIITDRGLTVVINSQPIQVTTDHYNFDKVVEAIRTQQWDLIPKLLDLRETIRSSSKERITIDEGKMYIDGQLVESDVYKRIRSLFEQGFDVMPMVNFYARLHQNGSYHVVANMFDFIEQNDLPISEDGHFFAYKRVTAAYYDEYTKTIWNGIDAEVTMPRNQVDDDPRNSCGPGLHFGSRRYFGSNLGKNQRLMLVQVDPADVVAIPGQDKCRCCRYTVVAELNDYNDKLEPVIRV